MDPRPTVVQLILLAVVAMLASCASPWGVDTLYVIEDIDEDAERRIERALSADANRYGFEIVSRTADSDAFRFRLTRVADVRALHGVRDTIHAVSLSAKVPVVLEQSSLTFASVSGHGQARIEVSGEASPGATVLIDVGGRVITPSMGPDNRWSARIERGGQLTARRGWVYGLICKGSARQYIRMNVLDTDACERILREELPEDSPLLHH